MQAAAIAVLITDSSLVNYFASNPAALAKMLDDVKNSNSEPATVTADYVASHLEQALGLSVPHFEPAAIPAAAPSRTPLSIFREPPLPDLYGSNRDAVTDAISDMRDAIEDVVASIKGLRDALTPMARHAYQQHGMELVRIGSELVDAYSAASVALLGDDSTGA